MLHLISFLVLLFRIRTQRSCRGVSLKTQLLFLIVFCCRYLDLFFSYISLYNTVMKIFFIAATATTVYWMVWTTAPAQRFSSRWGSSFDSEPGRGVRHAWPEHQMMVIVLGRRSQDTRHLTTMRMTSSMGTVASSATFRHMESFSFSSSHVLCWRSSSMKASPSSRWLLFSHVRTHVLLCIESA